MNDEALLLRSAARTLRRKREMGDTSPRVDAAAWANMLEDAAAKIERMEKQMVSTDLGDWFANG